MKSVTTEDLIEKAKAVIRPKKLKDFTIGDVGCALLTDAGNIYFGVCIDVGSGIGFCAEHSAIAAMITAGEYRIRKLVAVWRDEENNSYFLAPCGRCREFMRQIHPENLAAEIILDYHTTTTLAQLLPYDCWVQKIVKIKD